MELVPGSGLGHLTYCTNIHAAEDWPDVIAGLRIHLPGIKQALSPDRPFGVGLRLAASAANALRDPATFDELKTFLDDGGYYVFTINGFPYGAFHGQPVKAGAYRPDWSEPLRRDYSNTLADLLAAMLPDGMEGSVSTVPGSFKPWVEADPSLKEAITAHIIDHVAHLVAVRDKTGKTVNLALEPEPFCMLETIEETIRYFEDDLFGAAAVQRLASASGLNKAGAEDALRRHLGVCYDVCHAAVEFEDPRQSLQALEAAGIRISKLQLSAALKVARIDRETATLIGAMDEPVYLHQVVSRKDGSLERFEDIPAAMAALDRLEGAEWRTHFHVPIFLEEMQRLATTQDFLRDVLACHKETPVTEQLEVETYTWDVLPEAYRNVGIGEAIVRELDWVRGQLS